MRFNDALDPEAGPHELLDVRGERPVIRVLGEPAGRVQLAVAMVEEVVLHVLEVRAIAGWTIENTNQPCSRSTRATDRSVAARCGMSISAK